MTAVALPPVLGPLAGWCSACHDAGDFVPAVDAGLQACQAHMRLLPARPTAADQLTLEFDVAVVPPALRTPHPTGEQQWCAVCVAARVPRPRLGLSGRTAGDSTPLCLTCWRARTDRARGRSERRGLGPQEAGWLADLQVRLRCEVCGRPDGAGDCWRCGDQASFLAAARAVHEYDQAQAAAEAERVDELQVEHEAALARIGHAERRLQQVVVWHERLERVVTALPRLTKTGPRGGLQVAAGGSGWSRAWWLLADFLARDAADRTARGLSRRGRPSQLPLVVAVMAVAASHESGRGAMQGLGWTAQFAGVAERTVTTGWARTVELGCTTRIERGRILTVDERRELGRHRQRAVYDFAPLHRSPVDAQPFLAAAAGLLAQLLEHAVRLVDEHQALVNDVVAAAAAVEAELLDVHAWRAEQHRDDLALQASVDLAWTEQAVRAAQAALQARARATRAASPLVHAAARTAALVSQQAREAASRTVDNAFEQARRMTSFCDHPHRGSSKRSSSGSYWGLLCPALPTSPIANGRRPNGRGAEHGGGAARPSPTTAVAEPTTSRRPRTVCGVHHSSPQRAGRPAVMWWAKPLARVLAGRWEFLQQFLNDADDGQRSQRAVARERGLRLRMIAATLGKRLGPDWTADDVVQLVEQHGLTGRPAGLRTIIAAGDAHSPLRYLTVVLDRALTSPATIVPRHSPVRQAYERAVLAVEVAAAAERTMALHAERAERDAAAAAYRSGPQPGRAAALAAARAATKRSVAARQARAERLTEASAELWPAPAQPGSGRPSH